MVGLKGAHGVLEDDALIVPIALPLRFDAVVASRFGLVALDASPSTCFVLLATEKKGKKKEENNSKVLITSS